MTKVKICGLTNLDDAITAMEAGADYLGFILYPPSKRGVTEKQVQCIVAHLRSLPKCPTLVGVFVNEDVKTVRETLAFCDLDVAQLHGDESAETLHALQPNAYKAVRPQTLAEARVNSEQFAVNSEQLPSILIDAYHPDLYGGTGEVSDWEMARRLLRPSPTDPLSHREEGEIKLMLAGGLSAENVANAICVVRPYAVDVASGVEASPGKKDPDKVRRFVEAAKNC